MAVQAVPAAVYIGGSAVIAAFAYATNPELREATGSLANHLGNNFNNNVSAINDFIFGEDEAPAAPATGTQATTETATGEQTCPALPYWHYSDSASVAAILASRTFIAQTLNYFTNRPVGPRTVFYVLFAGLYQFRYKPYFFVQITVDCTVPLIPGRQIRSIAREYTHPSPFIERPPHMVIMTSGPNVFPDHPNHAGYPIPP